MKSIWKKWGAALPSKARGWLIWLVMPGLLLAAAGCRPAPPVVKIGFAAPFEGRHRPVGYDGIYAARLAVREQNAAGGIGPYRLGLVAMDDGSEPDQAVEVGQSLGLDEEVVAVIGHGLPETNARVAEVYAAAGLPFLALGETPFAPFAVETLPASFLTAYAAVTPFEETAGPYSGPVYDAFQLVFAALEQAAATGPLNRARVQEALSVVEIEGVTGRVYSP